MGYFKLEMLEIREPSESWELSEHLELLIIGKVECINLRILKISYLWIIVFKLQPLKILRILKTESLYKPKILKVLSLCKSTILKVGSFRNPKFQKIECPKIVSLLKAEYPKASPYTKALDVSSPCLISFVHTRISKTW